MGQGRENLFTRGEVAAMLALERPAFRQAFNEYQEFNAAVISFLDGLK